MDVKRLGLLAAGAAVAGAVTFGLTHPASARDGQHGRHIGPTRTERSKPPKFTPIAPADRPNFTPIAPADRPNFTPIAPADRPNFTPIAPANPPRFTPIAPADKPNFTPIAPADKPNFTPIAPADKPAGGQRSGDSGQSPGRSEG